jgi:hypothetical protein
MRRLEEPIRCWLPFALAVVAALWILAGIVVLGIWQGWL